jgi:mRNA-degrading endonuclease YafQ of YafQ-DinJ toxin-antitoxin module
MLVLQTKRFEKAYKRLHPNQLAKVNQALETIIKAPDIGEQKKGDLAWLRVYKFNMVNQSILIGYSVKEAKETILTFIDMGAHENFYRDLKTATKKRIL